MGDEVVATTGAVSTETAAAAPKLSRAEQDAADKAAFLSGAWETDDAEPEKPAAAAPKKKPAAAPVEAEDDDEETVDDDDVDDDDLEDLVDDDDADEDVDDDGDDEDAKAPKDDEAEKRIAKVRRAEQRAREQHAARDRELQQKHQAFIEQMKPKLEALDAFERIPKHDVAAILKAKGYTEDDFEDAARMLYGMSKAAAADPKNREAVIRMQKDRELRDLAAQADARAKALEEKLAARDAEAQQNQFIEQYMGRIHKSIGDETPLAKKRLELAPKATKQALAKVAHALSEKKGELVDPKKVARAYEKRLGKALERAKLLAGDDTTAAPAKGKVDTKVAAPAKKSAPIKVVDNTTDATTNGKKPLFKSREEMIADLGKLERGEIELD